MRWQKWHFRFALPSARRRGALHRGLRGRRQGAAGDVSRVALRNGGAVRRPTAGWFFRNSFDAGELGLGVTASPLRPGLDCPQNCTVFDAVVAERSGEPRTIPGAVALYRARRRRRLEARRQHAPRARTGALLLAPGGQLRVRLRLGLPPGRHARNARAADRHHGRRRAWSMACTTPTATWWRRISPRSHHQHFFAFGWIWMSTARRTA